MSFYRCGASATLHQNPDCVKRLKRCDLVPGVGGFRGCKRCVAPARNCLVCLDDAGVDGFALCEEHTLCAACVEMQAVQLAANPLWTGAFACPCGAQSEATHQRLPPVIRALCDVANDRDRAAAAAPNVDPVAACLADLTPACPTCKMAYVDFDACSVLTCRRCASTFCAWCSQLFTCNREAHVHVRTCSENPKPNTLYPALEDWEEFLERRAARVVRRWIGRVYDKNRCVLEALGFAGSLRKRGVHVLGLLTL